VRALALFALGALFGVAASAVYLGLRPPASGPQVMVPAPPPEPTSIAPIRGPVARPAPVETPPAPAAVIPPAPAPVAETPTPPPPIIVTPTPPEPSGPKSPGSLVVPVAGVLPHQLRDNFNQRRGKELHEALDIMAPRGTPVVAVEDGRIVRLFTSKPGGLTIYQFDPTEKYSYYYAHLDRYAQGIAEKRQVKKGEVIGYVGSTGNASPDAPHLHFQIFELNADKRWWQGKAINPYPVLTSQQRLSGL
jgi:murein DD-endopeptidase MepM/ murein hydrolase activator NlpD